MRFASILILVLLHAQSVRPLAGQEVRVIEFPKSHGTGVVEVFSSSDPDLFTLYNEESRQFSASGSIQVDSDAFVFLRLGQAQDLSFLDALPAESIQALELWNRKLDRELLTSIAKLRDLRLLRLSQCSFDNDAFNGIAELPNLELLTVLAEDRDDRAHVSSLLQWVAKQRKLKTFHSMPSIDATGLKYLEGHPSLAWLSIELNKDREAIILRMLGSLPALRNLTLTVDENVSPRALDRVGDLKDLEELSVFSCEIDGPLIEEIAKCKKLWNLRLANFEAGEGFVNALPGLTSLRSITVSHNGLWRNGGQLVFNQTLTPALLKLPRLQEGLRINKLDEAIWEKLLLSADRWKELRIEGVHPGFEIERLKDLPRFKNLERLKLSHVPLADDDLQWLNGLNDLQELTLFMTKVAGPGLTHLAALPSLRKMLIAMESRVVEPDLVHLRELTQLRDLQVMGFGFTSEHFEALAESRKLKKLVLQLGQKDDALAAALSTHPSLRKLSFGESDITDDGLKHLAEISSLRELTGSGRFTAEGIQSLNKLANLSRLHLSSQSLSEEDCKRLLEMFLNVGDLGFRQ